MNQSKVKLRQASTKDIPIILNFIKEFYALESILYLEQRVHKALIQLINSDDIGRVWLIYNDSTPVGYVVLCFSYSIESYGQEGMIDELYISDKFRSKGIGTQAVNGIIKNAKKLGLNCLYMEVKRENPGAHDFYKRLNFKARDKYFLMKREL